MTLALCFASFAAGVVCHRAASRYQVVQTLKLAIQFRRSGDVEPSEFSHGWERR